MNVYFVFIRQNLYLIKNGILFDWIGSIVTRGHITERIKSDTKCKTSLSGNVHGNFDGSEGRN